MRKGGLLLSLYLLLSIPLACAEDRYASLERHALAATKKDEKSLESLAKYLDQGRTRTFYDKRVKFWTRNWAGDEATALEIYVWVASRIRYLKDYRKQSPSSDQEALRVLTTRYGVCHDYAVLYHALATKAGLDAEYVNGLARYGRGDNPGRHAWNAVCIAGDWRMVDSCWARNPGKPGVDYQWFLLSPERFTESHLPWEEDFNDQPCCEYLRRMDRKKLIAIRHKMGTRTMEYRPAYQPWSWFED